MTFLQSLLLLACLCEATVLLQNKMNLENKESSKHVDRISGNTLFSLIAEKTAQIVLAMETKRYQWQKIYFPSKVVLLLTLSQSKFDKEFLATYEFTFANSQDNFNQEVPEMSATPEPTSEISPETKIFNLFNVVIVLFWTLLFFIMLSLIVYNICCKKYPTQTVSSTSLS